MSSWKHKFLRQQIALSDMIGYYDYAIAALKKAQEELDKAKRMSVKEQKFVWMACRDWEYSTAVGISPDDAINSWLIHNAEDNCIDRKTVRKYRLERISDTRCKAIFEACPMWLGYEPDDTDYYQTVLHITKVPFGTALFKE